MLGNVHKYSALVFVGLVLTFAASPVLAQPGSSSELDLLRRDEIHSEIGLSDEQAARLREIQDNTNPGREAFNAFAEKLRNAKDEDERNKLREELTKATVEARIKFEQQAIDVLNDEQKKKLRGLYLTSAGSRALANDRIAAEYGLTDEQKQKIEELSRERRTASRALGFDVSEEDRAKFDKDWQDKLMAVLTDGQKQKYEQQLAQAPPPAAEEPEQAVAAQDGGTTRPYEGDSAAARQRPASEPPEGETASASFGGGPLRADGRVEKFSFNFRYAAWDQVLEMFAEGAGLTLDLNAVPPGTFSHYDDNEYTVKQALDIMNGYLLRKGYAMVQKDGFLVVLNIDSGIPPSLIPERTVDDLLKMGDELVVGDNELVSVTIPVEGLDTAVLAREVEALLGPWGSMIALTESGILILTDIGANLRRIHRLVVAASDKDADRLIFEPYYLKYIDADEAELQVMGMFGMQQAAVNVSNGGSGDRGGRDRGSSAPSSTAPTSASGLQLLADLRTNSLYVTGTAAQHALVDRIVKAIDVGTHPETGNELTPRGKRGTYLDVYKVSSSDAGEVAKTISAMNMAGVTVVNEDRRNGAIHIMANARQHEELAALIRQLDAGGGAASVAVYQLHKMDPLAAAATLRSLFLSEGDGAPTIETDLYGRRLIIRGSIEQIAQIRSVMTDLGENGSAERPQAQGGKVRTYSLQGRGSGEFLNMVQDLWQAGESNPIRIRVPSRGSIIEDVGLPQGDIPDNQQPRREQRRGRAESGEEDPLTSVTPASGYQPVTMPGQDNSDSDAVAADQGGTGPRRSTEPAVQITVIGDELILSSNDEEALDRLEVLMDNLQQSLPYQTKWRIRYLQSADVSEAADMLAQIFPSSSVATTTASTGGSFFGALGGGFSSLGSSLADATGLSGLGADPMTLQIIPDVRSNALWLAGPESLLRDVDVVLAALDSNEIPESLRDMQPRTIEVKYGDVEAIATIVRDVYKPLMEVQGGQNGGRGGGGGGGGGNPLAAMFGGGGNNDAQQIRMTLGVDRQTSTLIVSSSEDVFRGVEDTVKTLDDSARDANRMISVVRLKNADPSLIERSITSLLPRVSVTSSSTSGTSSTSSGSSGGGDNRGGGDDAAAEFRQRMIERFRGGGGGGPGGGGGAPGGGFGGRGGFGGGGGGFGGGGGGFGGGGRGGGGRGGDTGRGGRGGR